MSNISITKTIRGEMPQVSFAKIARDILPEEYELSVVLIADKLGKKLNQKYKKRDYPTNVLSFSLSGDSGEIFINVRKAEREAKRFHDSTAKSLTKRHITYLFIHGCLHLAGYTHGKKMELLEQKYLKKFS